MKELNKKKYVTLITIIILVMGIIGIINVGNIDLDKGKVKLKSASIEKLKSSVIESKGYEEITYPVLYELEKVEGIEERTVIIKGTLTKEENKYARFKEITSNNITSTVSENGRKIEIKIEKVKLGRQNKINLKIEINGAINETKIKPEIEIKEVSEKEYIKVKTEEIEVKTNSVTGLVQDEEGMSVSNLELSVNKGNEEIRRTYTDENGRYVFSDVEEGKYTIKVEEENYELKEIKEVEVIGGITENIIVKKIKPYEIEVKKYISKIKLNNNGKEIEYEYGKLNKINQTVKNLKNLSGEIEYKIEIKNIGEKSGEITKIEEEVTEGLKFNKEKNSEWEEKNGKIINRSLEGIKLKAGEEKEITLKLDIEKTDEARSYLQKVTAKGEVYQNVVYILGGKEYKKEKVLEGEKIEEPNINQENFKGWYTDKNYTNKYNFENSVTKDIILYGKIEESTKKYTVQYIDEGKIIKEEELEEGSIINAPEVTKEGHTFIGWYEGEEKYDVYEPITRNLILESKYEINKYKVRFINEDESVLQEEILEYGNIPTYKKETPTKTRTEEYTYEFDKWSPEITKVTSDQEYKATYKKTKNKYTITYINEGTEYHKETLEYGSVVTEIQDPTKEGYTFTGWYTKDNEKVSYPITITKNITLCSKYEINSYKVSYYNEGKKYIDDQKINYGENALKPNTNPSKIGYTFKYWSLKENGEEYEFSTKITKDITLYAVYEINKYTLTYINEGIEYHKETAEYGNTITSIQNPTKEGYTFTGWYTKDNEKVSYPITVTEDITLYSKYEINSYKVSYYNEGKKYIDDQKINYGENALKPNTNPSKIGYTFKYWSLKENGKEYEFSTKITKDITLYAVYEINKYTVTYINEGIEYHKETAEYGSIITEIQDPTKEGYTFTGWYTKGNEKVSYPITVTKNITLYSKYEINSYKVSYYNEGKKYIEDQKINYGENALKPNTNPSKIGYTFKYWSLKENGEEYEFSTKITKNITLYAVYEINKYTLTYINEGIEYHKETAEYGSVITSIQDPIKEGYTFIGWYDENNQKVSYPITVTEDITLHSKYEINTYTVSFYHNNEKYAEDQKVNYGESAVKPSTDPTKEDYNFSGWVIKGTNNKYDFTSNVTKDIELESSFTAKPTYTVTFKIGSEVILTENIIEGHKVTSKEAPYKKGYLFDKWYSDEELTIENNFDEKIMNNKTIYGKYNENKHTVTYINEGTTYYTEEVLDSFTAKGPSTNPSKEGYTFKYFSKDKKVAFDYNAEITEDTTLYAVYEINKYTVTYINEESEYHKEELTYGSKHEKIEDPFKTGYTFIGWYNENEEKVEYPITVTKDITLHSKYEINKYTVTYINEGAKYIEDQQINYKEKAVKPDPNPSKIGYTFKYWSLKENGEEYTFNSEITKNITLYAVYSINKYTVTYINEESEYHKEELTYGSKHEKIEDPFKTGYTFIGWYNENQEKVEYPITVTKDITLHSKYEINKYTVTYINEGAKYIEDQQINYKEKAVKPDPNPSKIGYTFKYWSLKENGEEYTFNSEITKNITLYAVYEINKYTVTYINEESEYHKEELTYGSKHEKIEDPFKTGYTFIGWYNENEEKVEYPITVTKDITLHSKYEINKYTVTYINEGAKYIEDQQINYKEKAVKPDPNPSKIGYTFKYWSIKENGEEYNFNAEVTKDITLYAVYEINTYKVIFKNYDGSILQEETLEYRALPKYKGEEPTREKTKEYTYTFKGWDKEITEVTNNQEYIATYTEEKNKYNVKFTNYDGSILQEETLEYGTLPVYKGEVPTREKTEEYTYTFKSWNKEITEVTDNEIYIAVYTEEKNKYTVIYMDGENEYTRKEVNYGETVSEEVISKDHNIYRGWTLDGNIYDFNTPVTKNITINSSFELVESPVIESTPIEWTKENVKVTISSNHNDYSYMYKIDDGEYQNYNGEFTVDKNCTVIAKSIKQNVESEVTTKEITNIDKVLPEIKELTEENITTKSFDIKVKGQDNESGLSEIRIYKNDELMVSYPYTERLNEEKEEKYSLTGLEENTTYKIKAELIDKVGNINVSEEKEITTLKRVIVSRIIGRNNSLYESEEEYEPFESLENAITSCGSNECTIEMVLNTNESVNVLEGQEIKLELNGKTVSGIRDYTIENSGELIIDNDQEIGSITNTNGIGIKNIGNGILQIGENEEPLSVSVAKPNIVGTTYGIYTEEETAKLKFYDGKIEGNVAIQGNVDDTPYLYNAKITNEGHQVATLSILAEAEAKITGGKYYTKLTNAVSESKIGTYKTEEQDIMSNFITPGLYGFDYDEETKSLISNNAKIRGSSANSYIKLDLTDYNINQELTVTGVLSTYRHYGYAIVTNSKTIPTYNQVDGRVLYMTGENETKTETERIVLEKGNIYYLHLGYTKSSSYNDYTNNEDVFKITNITLSDYKKLDLDINYETDLLTPGTYGFINSDGVLKSNNQNKDNTIANSYIKVDLTNYIENQGIYIDAEVSSESGNDIGYITITDSETIPSYNSATGRVVYISGDTSGIYKANLSAGKINYIHLGYRKDGSVNTGTDTFTINRIYIIDRRTNTKNVITKVPVLNENVDTVELIKDVTLSSPIEVASTKEMILDLNGKTLTTTANDYVIKNSGNLTIIDSKYQKDTEKYQAEYEAKQAQYNSEYEEQMKEYNAAEKEYQEALKEYYKKLEEYTASLSVIDYDYTGGEQVYVVPEDGVYILETWGASGGDVDSSNKGGYGGYSIGKVSLNKGDILYINVGGSGNTTTAFDKIAEGGYNGGGDAINTNHDCISYLSGSGGGATHVATKSGLLSTLSDSLDSILIVSGGGGGSNNCGYGNYGSGGSGGGVNGVSADSSGGSNTYGLGATQETFGCDNIGGKCGSFGQGYSGTKSQYGTGGGSGLYGGGAGKISGSGGGSGYIGNAKLTDKVMYCYNCQESNDKSTKTVSTTNVSSNAITNSAKIGNGHVKITKESSKDDSGETTIIQKPEKPEMPDILRDDVLDINKSTFTYSGNGQMSEIDSGLNFYVNNSGNKSVTYYNEKINVEKSSTVKVNLSLYQNYYNNGGLLGTAYIGFSKTNEANTDDFVSYVEKDITSYNGTEKKEDIEITVNEPGEYYFKIVLYHNNNTGAYTVYSDLYSIKLSNKPELRKATLQEATYTGTITSSTNSIIYNDMNANLMLKEGILELNKSGEYNAITNDGTLSVLENSSINTKQANNRGIYNGYNGNIKDSGTTINQSSSGYGIYSVSKVDDGFSDITFNLNSGVGFYNAYGNIVVNNIKTTGSNGIVYTNTGTLTINDSSLDSRIVSNGTVTINNSTHKLNSSNDDLSDELTINDCNFTYNIGNWAIWGRSNTLNINNSTVTISHSSRYETSIRGVSNLNINNSTIKRIDGNTWTLIDAENVLVTGNSTITANGAQAINGTNVTIGEKDGNITSYPYITSNNYLGVIATNLYIYDGTITAPKENAIRGAIKEIEENSELNQEYEDNNEKYTLVTPTDVAQINDNKYTSLESAINAVQSDETIELLRDTIIINGYNIDESKKFKINLNTHKITAFNSEYLFNNKGDLTIYDSNAENKGLITNSNGLLFTNTGIISLDNISLNSSNTTGYNSVQIKNDIIDNYGTIKFNKVNSYTTSYGKYIQNHENATTKIESSTISNYVSTIINDNNFEINNSDISFGGMYGNGTGLTNNEGKNLTISNSTIGTTLVNNGTYISNKNNYSQALTINSAGNLTSTSDTFKEDISNSGQMNLYDVTTTSCKSMSNNNSGVINMYSGTINTFVYNSNTSTLNIYDGTIKSRINNNDQSTFNLIGGTINSSSDSIVNSGTGTINIGTKDGTVNLDSPTITSTSIGVTNNANGKLNFYDGKITGTTAISGPVTEIEDGYDILKETIDGKEVKYLAKQAVAQIESTGEKYNTIQEAIDAVTNTGETIKLLRELTTISSTSTITVPEDKDIILDLNGYKILQNNTPFITNNGTFTLKDSAETTTDSNGYTVYSGTITSSVGNVIENNGTFNYDGGTITSSNGIDGLIINNGLATMNGGYLTSADWSTNLILNKGDFTINNGYIISASYSNKSINNSGTLTINDGTFKAVTGNNGSGNMAYIINNTGTTNIYGGTVQIDFNYNYPFGFINNESSGNVLIDGLTNVLSSPVNFINNIGIAKISNSTIIGRIYNSGTMDLINLIVNNTSQRNGIYNSTGTLNIHSGEYNVYTENNGNGTMNIIEGTFISGVSNTSTGTINIGTKGDLTEEGELNVSKTNPNITNSNGYGLTISNGKVNFYDGIISGTSGAISGTVNEIEDGYEIISGKTEDGKESKYLALLPVAKIVSTNEEYYNLQDAIDAVTKTGETIKIIRKYTTLNTLETIIIPEDKNIIIDLNGYTIEQNNENLLVNNGTLKITDSSENNTSSILMNVNGFIENNKDLTMENIKINTENISLTNVITNNSNMIMNNSNISGKIVSNIINNIGTLNMKNSSITITSGGQGNGINNSGTLTMEDSSLTLGLAGNMKIGVNNSGILNITNGNYSVSNYYDGTKSEVYYNTGKINITGGTYNLVEHGIMLISNSEKDSKIDGITLTSSYEETIVNRGSGTLDIENSTITSVDSSGSGIVNLKAVIISNSVLRSYDKGTINVYGATINGGRIENSSLINIYDINLNLTDDTIRNYGTINIYGGTLVSSNGSPITNYNDSRGTINIGTKDGNVSTEVPVITGKTYGVSNSDSGKVNFYDGIVSGETGAFYGTVNEVEPGYKVVTNKVDTLTSATLALVGDDEKVAVLNGINFSSLQDAINSASDTTESIITLYANIVFDSNITVPANKNIKLYLNGYTLNKGSYDFTGEGKITVIDGTSTNALASIIENVKEVLNIGGINKNIIIYEMDDGSAISSESTYKLYKDNEEVMLEEDAIGIYSLGNSNDEIRSANKKIYINELPKGKYKLIGDNNKEVKFEIDESGKIIGNVKENTKETSKIVSIAVAELIIMIQTGIEKVNYIMIILTLLVTISSLLYIVKKVNVRES